MLYPRVKLSRVGCKERSNVLWKKGVSSFPLDSQLFLPYTFPSNSKIKQVVREDKK